MTSSTTPSSGAPPEPRPDLATGDSATVLARLAQDPSFAENVSAMRDAFQTRFARAVLAMMGQARYRHLAITDLEAFVIEPLLRDQLSVVTLERRTGGDASSYRDPLPYTGVVISARVSPEVDARISEQIKAGTFPVRLRPEDWTSGDILWLLDVIAPDDAAARETARAFAAHAEATRFNAHPRLAYFQPQLGEERSA